MKISVVINTLNSERYLAQVIEEVKNFDEILVVDLGSTDSTLSIARKAGARIESFDFSDGATLEDARNYSLNCAKYEWVFFVEPNELVTDALIEYLYAIKEIHPGANGLFIPRKNHLMFHFQKHTYPDFRLRMFRQPHAKWPDIKDSIPVVDGELTSIPADREDCALVHLSGRFQYGKDRAGRDMRIRELNKPRKDVSIFTMWLFPLLAFLKTYILEGAVFHGREGYIISAKNASSIFMELAKVHEIKRLREFNKSNKQHGISMPEPDENGD